ncbi:hypothetical protein Pmani_018911, partial [Petrolisthes manimaculis]
PLQYNESPCTIRDFGLPRLLGSSGWPGSGRTCSSPANKNRRSSDPVT